MNWVAKLCLRLHILNPLLHILTETVFVMFEFDTTSFSGSGFMELAFSNENMAGCKTTGTTVERASTWVAYDRLLCILQTR